MPVTRSSSGHRNAGHIRMTPETGTVQNCTAVKIKEYLTSLGHTLGDGRAEILAMKLSENPLRETKPSAEELLSCGPNANLTL
jgi:hypothetical protein